VTYETSRLNDADNGLDGPILVWWKASCGATHYEINPVTIEYFCATSFGDAASSSSKKSEGLPGVGE